VHNRTSQKKLINKQKNKK